MPREIDRLDVMIAYSCNLSCRGCISVSDRPRDGVASLEDIQSWLTHWSGLITPAVTTLFGGEPCLHPRLMDICRAIRQHWPHTVIRLITNGYLLDRFDPAGWFEHAPFEMQISIHRSDHESLINGHIRQILAQHRDWTVARQPQSLHEQLSWSRPGMRIYKSIFGEFVVPFRENGQDIHPWHSRPEAAHAICGAPNTPVLYKGMLYKCPAVANVIDLTGKNWFDYEACAGESGLEEFVARIGRPERVCGQCPERHQAHVVNHLDKNNVIVKQKITD